MSMQLFLSAVFLSVVLAHPPKCFLPLSSGTNKNCENAPSQKYHYDPKLNQCHAFQYKGCGGTLNNYETPKDCEEACYIDPKTYIQCPLGTRTVFDSKNNNICPIDSKDGEGCESPDAICTNFTAMALCCNRTVTIGYEEDKSSMCPSRKARWQIDGVVVLAKSCGAVVCPSGYSCKDGNFFSYCCEN
ncbi:hypothetical protein GCK72_018463 [Caenorhabditis remanei]|uniref:BPTI/Kunitz inhibitor domain-containing protein n=1 Tax=Caenorhabditis remanei TaxID=31234 RepID=E3LNZ1_CAERE|nr:hypothetical protein GCK72_018463 [Caenorhabditis remanei]EFP05613.1 hypothetical protein CRE_27194 [Caenorhabditis remanei]KAF1751909.1 hypothetical protein GCK72_018463 [Caenorhabditis remanei]